MTRYLLDINVISNITKPVPSVPLLAWMAGQADEDLFIASLVVAEVWFGVLECPKGRRRTELERWFAGPEGPQALFAGRILAFDERAGVAWAHLMSEGARAGRPRSALDMMVAAVAKVNGCVVVTDNEPDFEGLNFINPMRSARK